MPSEMGQAALDRLGAQQSAPAQEAAPPPAPSQDPNVGGAPPQQAEPQGAQPVVDDGAEEFEYYGEKVKLARNERHYLMQLGLDAYERLRAGEEQPAQPAQPAQPQGEQEHPIFAQVRTLEQELGKMKSEARKEAVMKGATEALEGNEFLRGWASKQPAERKPLMAEIIQFQAAHPRMSYESAAKHVATRWQNRFKADRAVYAQEKIQAAGSRVETGGVFPVQQKKMGAKDFRTGAVRNAALERAERYAAANR